MDSSKETSKENMITGSYENLVSHLDELAKLYRSLFETVKREKDFLVQAELDALTESNKTKEALIYKIRNVDQMRERSAAELAHLVGASAQPPRLLDIATKMDEGRAHILRTIHGNLDMTIQRVSELNRENEQYAQSALDALGGALGEIRDTLVGKKTYGKRGNMKAGPDKAGNFVSKEA